MQASEIKNHLELISYGDTQQPHWDTPQPIRINLLPVMPLTSDMLPPQLRDYIHDVAERQQSPVDFVAVSALCGLATAIGNGVRIAPKQYDDWKIVPNLWGAIIGRPSAMKSPAMQSALAPVYAIQKDMLQEWQNQNKQSAIDQALQQMNNKQREKKALEALKKQDREVAKKIMTEIHAVDDVTQAPQPRLIVNDATVEKLGELLNENPRGLLLVRDELAGFLSRMEKEEYQSERAFYIEAYNGDGQFTYDRIGRGTIHIQNATLSMIGGIQPSRIASLIANALSGKGDDGLIQRLQLIVWPDDIKNWQWTDQSPDSHARQIYEGIFSLLHEKSIGSPENPVILRFSLQAQELFRHWITDLQSKARDDKIVPALESHLLKMPKTVASLALIFELVSGGRDNICMEAINKSLQWADYLESHARRLYASSNKIGEEAAKLIVARRGMIPPIFTLRDIHQRGWENLTERDSVKAAIELLCQLHHIRKISSAANQTGGRPSTRYEWNPILNAQTT